MAKPYDNKIVAAKLAAIKDKKLTPIDARNFGPMFDLKQFTHRQAGWVETAYRVYCPNGDLPSVWVQDDINPQPEPAQTQTTLPPKPKATKDKTPVKKKDT